MGFFRTNKYKKVKKVVAWFEVKTMFDLDKLGIDTSEIRKMFMDNGDLCVQYHNGVTERFDPGELTIEFEFPKDITFIDSAGNWVWEFDL